MSLACLLFGHKAAAYGTNLRVDHPRVDSNGTGFARAFFRCPRCGAESFVGSVQLHLHGGERDRTIVGLRDRIGVLYERLRMARKAREFGGYLAQRAEALVAAHERLDEAEEALRYIATSESDESSLDAAREAVCEATKAVRSAIYEFRKRDSRAA